MNRFHQLTCSLMCGSVLAMGSFSVAFAEEDKDTNEAKDVRMEEITVTATRREESVLEVPVPITAFSDTMIEKLGMTNTDDLEQLTPGLQFGTAEGQGTTIRGVSSRLWQSTHADQAVAYYVDGVYSYSLSGVAPHMFDVSRVEVARGPQGTVNGRNSIAGSISFFPKRPTDVWDTDLLVEFTDQQTQRYNVAWGGPLTDWLSFRITAGTEQGDGAFENIGLGPDAYKPDQWFAVPQLRFQTDRMEINIRYAEHEDTGVPRPEIRLTRPPADQYWYSKTPLAQSNTALEPSPWYLDTSPLPASSQCGDNELPNQCDDLQLMLNTNAPTFNDDRRRSLTLNAEFAMTEKLSVTYSYGSSEAINGGASDLDGSNGTGGWEGDLWWVNQDGIFRDDGRTLSSATGAIVRDRRARSIYTVEQSSHELIFKSDLDGPFNFLAGVFYYENDTGSVGANDDYTGSVRFNDNEERWDDMRLAAFPPQAWGVMPLYEAYMAENYGYDLATAEFGVDGGLGIAPGGEEECDRWAEFAGDRFLGPVALSPNFFMTCDFRTDRLEFLTSSNVASSETEAVFVHGDYEFGDFKLAGGARYTSDSKSQTSNGYTTLSDFSGVIIQLGDDDASDDRPTWNQVIWDVSLDYKPTTETMYYGRISTGYRAGSFASYNAEADFEEARVKEETLTNFEIGFKSQMMDGDLTITSSAFYSEYEDMQIFLEQNYPPGAQISLFSRSPLISRTANIPTSKLYGAEVEFAYYIGEKWRFSGYYVYFNSSLGAHESVTRGHPNPTFLERDYLVLAAGTFTPDPDAPAFALADWIDPGTPTQQGVPLLGDDGQPVPCSNENPVCFSSALYQAMDTKTGNEMPKQPNHKVSLTGSYTHPLKLGGRDLGLVTLLSTYTYTGARHPYISNLKSQEMRAYGRWDARLTWESVDGGWSAAFWVQNIMDDVGLIEYVPESGRVTAFGNPDGGVGFLTDGRRIGMVLRWKM